MQLFRRDGTVAAPISFEAEAEGPRAVALEQWSSGSAELGVLLSPDADVEALAEDLSKAPFVVLSFSKMADGRPFSQARLLRGRLKYAGDIVASGPVTPDQATFLWRSGFSGALLAREANLEVWSRCSSRYPEFYQPAVGDA